MAVIVYNKNHEEHYGDNVFYIGRGSVFGNPFTHIKDCLLYTSPSPRDTR